MAPRQLLWASGVVIFLLMMGTAFIGYVLPWGQMCENSCDNKIGKRCYSDIKPQGVNETRIHCPKHCVFYAPLELIRKNPAETSLPRQKESINTTLRFTDEVSNVSFGMNAHLYPKTAVFLKKLGTTSNGYVLLLNRFSRQEACLCYCRRTHGRTFCTSNNSTNTSFDFRTEDIIDVEKEDGVKTLTKSLIVGRDLKKELVTIDSSMDINRRLTTFKINKCGKYINITKELLCDPDFLRLAYSKIKSNNGVNTKATDNETLDAISSEWFDKAANLIKNAQYKFKPARMKDIPKASSNEKRIITITNSRDKIIQKAIALVLEMIYERDEVFLEVSHGFRPNKGCHTALKQIKYGWSAIPWYIEADVSKAFDDINRNILINLLKKKISDKRFIDLILQMYKVDILNLKGFWLKKKNGIMQGNILSPILCNIYLHELDSFVINDIINKYKKGDKPVINKEYRKLIGLKEHEKRLPQHIQKTITQSRRRQIEKRGIKRVVESEEFIRIKYVRYADDFIIGVRGSKELAEKICKLTKNFLASVLELKLNMDKTLITNTYAEKAKFLGFEIFNKNAIDLPYRNSREIENYKRVKKKNKIIKQNLTNKIKKKTREKVLKWIDKEIANGKKENLKETLSLLGKSEIRNKLRHIVNIIHEEVPETCEIVEKKTQPVAKKIEINRPEILRRIHLNLLNYGVITTTTARGLIKPWKYEVERYLKKKKLTYCPEIIELNDIERADLIFSEKGMPVKKTSSGKNLLAIVKILYSRQEKLTKKNRVTFIESKSSLARIDRLNEGTRMAIRPIIKINKKKVYDKLLTNGIMNSKNNPCCKVNITSSSDYNIVLYFRRVMSGLLSYYRCADDFYKMKNIVNWFVRYSAISTLKHKHKLASRKTVVEKYKTDLECENHKKNKVKLMPRDEVNKLKKDFLINTDFNWEDDINKTWITFSNQETFYSKCAVKNCSTPTENIEIHHMRRLYKEIDENGYIIIKGKSRKLKGKKAFESGLTRKQIPLCRNHHKDLHKNIIKIEDLNIK